MGLLPVALSLAFVWLLSWLATSMRVALLGTAGWGYPCRTKGAECDYNIIAGVTEGIVTLRRAVSDEGSVLAQEENKMRERALLYVAATRARREVLVTCHGKPIEFIQPESAKGVSS